MRGKLMCLVAALIGLATSLAASPTAEAQSPARSTSPTPRFVNGFPDDERFFPIGVWLQNPRNAMTLKALGINTYVALWKGPAEAQLAQIAEAGMYAIVQQTEDALSLKSAHVIRGWMMPDEPDNAQRGPTGAYGDCLMPEEILARYRAIRERDTTRPAFLNFGQGLAHKDWVGRGTKCSKLDHEAYYAAASKGGDIVSFDIYPATEARQPAIYGRLDLVAEGVKSLARWAKPDRVVWNAIGTTHIHDPDKRPTPAEIRAQVWMSLIAGSRGIFYFLHEWKPTFREDAIFRYPEIVSEIARINREIEALAPVLNARVPALDVTVEARVRTVVMARHVRGATYVFIAGLEPKESALRVRIPGLGAAVGVAVGEDRPVLVRDGIIEDEMPPWGVRLYKIVPPGKRPS